MEQPNLGKPAVSGAWKLVGVEMRDPSGTVVHPFGRETVGTLMVDESGFVSVQIMLGQRPSFGAEQPTAEEALAAYSTFVAYSGQSVTDETTGTVTTRVMTALDPTWLGGEQVREYELQGDKLVLRTPPMKRGGEEYMGTFLWERLTPSDFPL